VGPGRRPNGADVNAHGTEGHRWLLVRQGPLGPEERAVFSAARRRLRAERRELVTVLLGTSSYDADSPDTGPDGAGEEWILEDDARGRGIRRPTGSTRRIVPPDKLVAAIMSAERVIQFP